MSSPRTLQYGASDQQVVELWHPVGEARPKGLVILIHGGYWRAKFDASLMHPLARSLVVRGWSVANVEYRRIGNGGGWPTTLEDVRAGIKAATDASQWEVEPEITFSVGHSVGGQLALLGADLVDGVVALTPVTDLVLVDQEVLGEGAAYDFMGGHAADLPEEYAAASPVKSVPLGKPLLVIHGAIDNRVPSYHSELFCTVAHAAGDNVQYWEVPLLEHVEAIDPQEPHWANVVLWMDQLRK